MKKVKWFFAIIFAMVAFSGCESYLTDNEDLLLNDPLNALKSTYVLPADVDFVCGEAGYTLWAGQHMDYGTLVVQNDAENLYVTYVNTSDVDFGTLHLWVNTDFSLLPKNSQGTPVPGQFPLQVDASGLASYTFTIPLTNALLDGAACGSTIYVAAHAEMGEETAWGGNVEGTGTNRWYFYAAYELVCCDTPREEDPEYRLETAFMYGTHVFVVPTYDRRTKEYKNNPDNLLALNLTKNRWGWAYQWAGDGTISYTGNLYAGAGLNHIENGVLVGTVTLNVDGAGGVIVMFDLDEPYKLEEFHIYSSYSTPTTIAPGQYGYTYYFDEMVEDYTTESIPFVWNGVHEGMWNIVHAVVAIPVEN